MTRTVISSSSSLRRSVLGVLWLAALPVLTTSAQNSALDARQVMERVDNLADGETVTANYTMILIDRRDRQRTRELTLYAKDYDDSTRTLTRFSAPADISGTGYLNYDWTDAERDDDSWLYLPALQRVKRLASSETSDSFLGSDFTYADINGIELDWYDYSFVSESEEIDGQDCWVIDIVPKASVREKAEEATGYSRLRAWISKENLVQIRAQAWELRGNRIKYFLAEDVHQVQGYWTTGRLQAITTRNDRQEHASILQLNDVSYDSELNDEFFTSESLQRNSNPN